MDPMPTSPINAATLQAYRDAHYRVEGDRAFTLRIDHASPELRAAQRQLDVECSAYLSACNPLGALLGEAANQRRHAALIEAVEALGHPYWPGFGADPQGQWPGEPSLLVFGIPLAEARGLGEHFAQNAFVWAGADAVPRLILLR
jgi:hypothetical protein